MRKICVIGGTAVLLLATALAQPAPTPTPTPAPFNPPATISGFADSAEQLRIEKQFLAVPDPKRAEEHLRTLTSAPHMATTPEDYKTAEYVLRQYKEAGLDARIQEYKVYFGMPRAVSVELVSPEGARMKAPRPERVEGDPYQNDPRIVMNFNGFSPSADITADVVYVNYGRPEDFDQLEKMDIDVKGKIVIARYGENFRGVKAFLAQQRGAAGLIIYSDPWDDGYFKGDPYPKGPYRPDSGVQRGDIHYIFEYPRDPTTPGIASLPDLAEKDRTPPEKAASLPRVPSVPLSYADATPILQSLGGPASPRNWQGALPFTYHVGPGPAKVHLHVDAEYGYRTIWNVIGTIKGKQYPDELVISGNHRDAWVYGAVDPNSGTAAQLETVHGIGALLKSGWRPNRTMIFASWDAEEEGLIGSTEWAEQHANELSSAVAYLNMDVGVAGPNFGASSVPSLKQFIRDASKAVPSPKGGSVYEVWAARTLKKDRAVESAANNSPRKPPAAESSDVPVGDLGSGSDYTVFLQHLGVPALDIGSGGPYGVYHSAFDDFAWFQKFGDPSFAYEQQMARLLGVQMLRLADADILPLDYQDYGSEIGAYVDSLKKRAGEALGEKAPKFDALSAAAIRLKTAGSAVAEKIKAGKASNPAAVNAALREVERTLLGEGLPQRPWFRHVIYAPGRYTGYAAVVMPAVSEAIDSGDAALTESQIAVAANAINRAAGVLESIHGF